jgi:hypothetical protein
MSESGDERTRPWVAGVGGFELTNALPKLAFEVWPEFPFISERVAIRETFPG